MIKNLNFKKIFAKNFLCFGEEGITIDFSQYKNVVLIRGENKDVQDNEEERIASNGVGKSSVFEIISYALYGRLIKNSKKIGKDDVINNKIKNKLKVEVRWSNYRVVRTRKPDSVRLWEAPDEDFDWDQEMQNLGEDFDKKYEITKGTSPLTEKEIENKVGLKSDTFANLLVFADTNRDSFLEYDTPSKRSLVEDILSLDKYREYAINAKNKSKKVKDDIKLLSNSYELLKNEHTSCLNRISMAKSQEVDWKKNKEKELELIFKEIENKKLELQNSDIGKSLALYEKAQVKISTLETEINTAISNVEKCDQLTSDAQIKETELLKQKQELQSNITSLQSDINANIKKIKSNEITISSLEKQSFGETCSYCYGVVDQKNAAPVIENNTKEILVWKNENDSLKIDLDKFASEIAVVNGTLQKVQAQINQIKSKKLELNNKIVSLKKDLALNQAIKKPEVSSFEALIEQKIDNLKQMAVKKKAEIDSPSPFVEIVKNAEIEAVAKEQEYTKKKEELTEAEELLPYYSFYEKAFGDDGIRKFIIDDIIPALNNKIEYWLQFLIDNKISLNFNNKLEENIERVPADGDPFVYHAMSGGERRRLNLAVSQSFAHILSLTSGVSLSIVFLDEVTTNIDPIGVVGVYNMIEELSKDKLVFVTTHDIDLLQMLNGCETINLVKENGITALKS